MTRDDVLACSVRGCGAPLERGERSWRCANGHAFDVARSGYVNLLQPQDRRSDAAGDARSSVEARARLVAAGVARGLHDEIERRVEALGLAAGAVVLELGAGTGELLARLQRRFAARGIGIELSTFAAERAARTFPACTWLVANADRRLPILGRSVDLVLAVNARRNPEECARVLWPGRRLLAVVPAADDLVELRTAVHGEERRDRGPDLERELAPALRIVERATWTEQRTLARPELLDLLAATYRGARRSAAPRVDALDTLAVTFAADIVLAEPASDEHELPETPQGRAPE